MLQVVRNVTKALFNFFVGDLRILIGTLLALVVAAEISGLLPVPSGILLFAMIAITLAASLRREVK